MTFDPRPDPTSIEIDLLLEALYRRCGHDFRSYARSSIERRIRHCMADHGIATIADMIPRVLHDRDFGGQLIRYFSIAVTELFRDPSFYLAVRENVIPLLKTWPRVKIWHAGCASGEEVYSLAIMLKEEGVYDRATIHATDFSETALARARDGIYELAKMQEATRSYQHAGGKGSFSEYYHARYDAAVMDASLKERIVFSNHNLATDSVFGEMQLIFCRNVLIYFNRDLQDRVLGLFTQSLVHGGFLCLGTKENLQFSAVAGDFDTVDDTSRIYKRRGTTWE